MKLSKTQNGGSALLFPKLMPLFNPGTWLMIMFLFLSLSSDPLAQNWRRDRYNEIMSMGGPIAERFRMIQRMISSERPELNITEIDESEDKNDEALEFERLLYEVEKEKKRQYGFK